MRVNTISAKILREGNPSTLHNGALPVADNTIASGGDVVRTFDDATAKWEACIAAYTTGGAAGAWTVQQVDATHGLPVALLSGTLTTVTTVTTVSTLTTLSQFAGQAINLGNGTVGTGTLRVTMASDSTGTLAAVTNVATIGTSVTPGTSAGHLGKAEDAAHSSGDTGVMLLAVRKATAADLSAGNTDGDYEPLQVDANGRLHVIASSGIAGDVATGSADSGNPIKVGGIGHTANPTAVADAQRVAATFDKLGKQVVVGSIRDLKGMQATTITSSTAETTIVTQVASTFLDLYGLILANKSASATLVTIRDATGAGTPFVMYVPAGDTRGFMLPESGALKQGTVNTNWTATCGTSIDSLYVTALFVKNT